MRASTRKQDWYKTHKRPRNLKWRHSEGVVIITCTMVEQLQVQPLHVTMLLLLRFAMLLQLLMIIYPY